MFISIHPPCCPSVKLDTAVNGVTSAERTLKRRLNVLAYYNIQRKYAALYYLQTNTVEEMNESCYLFTGRSFPFTNPLKLGRYSSF